MPPASRSPDGESVVAKPSICRIHVVFQLKDMAAGTPEDLSNNSAPVGHGRVGKLGAAAGGRRGGEGKGIDDGFKDLRAHNWNSPVPRFRGALIVFKTRNARRCVAGSGGADL